MWTPLSSPPVWMFFKCSSLALTSFIIFFFISPQESLAWKQFVWVRCEACCARILFTTSIFPRRWYAKMLVRWHETKIHTRTDVLNSHVHSHNAHISIQLMFKAQQTIITPVVGYNSRPHLYSAQFTLPREHSLQSCLSWNYRQIHLNISFHILPGTHLYTWVETSNVDKLSCWKKEGAG